MQDEAKGGTVGLVAEFLEDKREFGWREREKKKKSLLRVEGGCCEVEAAGWQSNSGQVRWWLFLVGKK